MSTTSPRIQGLARRLLALEAAQGQPSDDQIDEAVKVCEKLRLLISKLVGVVGFGSLLARALAMTKREIPSLATVKVGTDGSFEGFDEVKRDQSTAAGRNGGVVLVAQLLGLLETFIGQSLTLKLVRDAWPGATLDEMDPGTGGMP